MKNYGTVPAFNIHPCPPLHTDTLFSIEWKAYKNQLSTKLCWFEIDEHEKWNDMFPTNGMELEIPAT